MADFSFPSDTDHSDEVEQILAEARDHCVLKQIAAINCSSFSHSVLPSDLDSRFQRLKTFPSSSKSKPQLAPDSATGFKNSAPSPRKDPERGLDFQGKSCSSNFSSGHANSPRIKAKRGDEKVKESNSCSGYVSSASGSSNASSGHAISPKITAKRSGGKVKEGKFCSGYVSSASDSSNSSTGQVNSPKIRAKSGDGKVKKGKSRAVKSSARYDPGKVQEREIFSRGKSGYVSSDSDDSSKLKAKSGYGKVKEGNSRPGSFSFRSNSSDSSSKTAKAGCFWCSPKKVSRKKSGKRDEFAELGLDYGGHDEILSDLKSISFKEQKKLVKKSLKEAEKINKETEKIVKWAKQASARLDFSLSDDELNDDDHNNHNFGLH